MCCSATLAAPWPCAGRWLVAQRAAPLPTSPGAYVAAAQAHIQSSSKQSRFLRSIGLGHSSQPPPSAYEGGEGPAGAGGWGSTSTGPSTASPLMVAHPTLSHDPIQAVAKARSKGFLAYLPQWSSPNQGVASRAAETSTSNTAGQGEFEDDEAFEGGL